LFSGEFGFHGSLSVGSAAHMYVQFVMFNRNISATVLRALELANFVDMVSMIPTGLIHSPAALLYMERGGGGGEGQLLIFSMLK